MIFYVASQKSRKVSRFADLNSDTKPIICHLAAYGCSLHFRRFPRFSTDDFATWLIVLLGSSNRFSPPLFLLPRPLLDKISRRRLIDYFESVVSCR